MNASIKTLAEVTICIVVVAFILVLSYQPYPLITYSDVPFEVIDPGDGYNYEQRANFTITNETEWENLWLELYSGHVPVPEVPTVNFTSEMLIAVFQGERGSSGYLTNITRIIMTDSYYVVYVDETHPGEDCILLTVMTYPYQIVKISDPLNLPIRFVYNIIIHECE